MEFSVVLKYKAALSVAYGAGLDTCFSLQSSARCSLPTQSFPAIDLQQ
jgi:hypothetical protein